MRQPYYGPYETKSRIDLERFFLAGDFVAGFGYGVQFVLWAICALYLRRQQKKGRKTFYLLCYITLLLAIETAYAVVQARTVQLMYVENRNYPGGPWQYFLDTQNLPVNVIFTAAVFSLTFLCDLLVFWRCWIIWTASGYKIAAYAAMCLPFVMLITSLVMGVLWTLQCSQPGLSAYSKEPLALGTAYYTLSLGTNVVLTALIVARLLAYRRAARRVHLSAENARDYFSAAALIIESAALHSTCAVAFLVSYALDAPINQIWLAFAQAAQQVSQYLIIYRIADGKAWKHKSTNTSCGTTTINFNDAHDNARSHMSGSTVAGVYSSTERVSAGGSDVL